MFWQIAQTVFICVVGVIGVISWIINRKLIATYIKKYWKWLIIAIVIELGLIFLIKAFGWKDDVDSSVNWAFQPKHYMLIIFSGVGLALLFGLILRVIVPKKEK